MDLESLRPSQTRTGEKKLLGDGGILIQKIKLLFPENYFGTGTFHLSILKLSSD